MKVRIAQVLRGKRGEVVWIERDIPEGDLFDNSSNSTDMYRFLTEQCDEGYVAVNYELIIEYGGSL
jgi:hypothetical protein